MMMPKPRHAVQCLLLLALVIAAGCVRPTATQLTGREEAVNFVSRQGMVLNRTGTVQRVVDLDASTTGRSMPFGWGDRSEENWVLQVEGERDTVVTRVKMQRTPKTPWRVVDWGLLPANDAAQYQPPAPPAP